MPSPAFSRGVWPGATAKKRKKIVWRPGENGERKTKAGYPHSGYPANDSTNLKASRSIHEHLLGVCACADHVDALGQGDGRCAGGGDEGADERAGQVVDVDRSGRGQREMEVAGGSVEARGRGLDVGCGQGADVDVAGGGEVAAVGRLDVDLGLTEAADRALGNNLSRRAAAKVIPRRK